MTNPVPGGSQSATAETGPDPDAKVSSESSNAGSNSDTVVVKCPQMTSVLKSADGSFPDITPKGTEMSKDEAAAAKKAAKALRIKLITNRGNS